MGTPTCFSHIGFAALVYIYGLYDWLTPLLGKNDKQVLVIPAFTPLVRCHSLPTIVLAPLEASAK